MFSVLAVLFYVIILWTTYYPSIVLDRPEYIPQLVLILILVPVMYITVFKVLWVQMKLYDAAAENRALNTQINMVNERLKASEEIESSMKILRHDIKHKMLLLGDYIKTEKYGEAEKYIDSLVEDADKITAKKYCDNRCANVVLSYYSKIAADKGIRFETNVTLPETLVVDETDLAVVLSNGLENAVNALEVCDNKQISVKGFVDADKIYIEIKNPFNNAVMFDGNMPRSKQENHGYGTRSMAAIVTKYDGAYSFTIEDGDFVFRCGM